MSGKSKVKEAWADHPYESPATSEADDMSEELNFEEYDGTDLFFDQDDPDDNAPSSVTGIVSRDNFCKCGHCTDCDSMETVCCKTNPATLDLINDDSDCVTSSAIFSGLLADGIEYTRFIHASAIKNKKKRDEYLAKPLTNTLKRSLLYRNFVIIMNKGTPLGKNNRIVIPRCVVERIRVEYPEVEGQYTGYLESELGANE